MSPLDEPRAPFRADGVNDGPERPRSADVLDGQTRGLDSSRIEPRHQDWCPRPGLPEGADRCPRCGCVQPGNQVARQTGIHAVVQPAALRDAIEDFRAGVVSDLGGDAELSTLERGLVDRLARVELTLRLLENDIAARGLLTPAGGVRNVYGQYLAGVAAWDRLAMRLGLQRRTKRVQTFADAVVQAGGRDV